MKTIPLTLLLALLVVSGAAWGQEEPEPAKQPNKAFAPGWYVAPALTYMSPDSARCNVDGNLGGSLAIGHRGDFAALEFWGQFMSLPHDGCTYTVPAPTQTDPEERAAVVEPSGTVKLNGGGLGLVVGPFFEGEFLARLYGVVGFGVLLREDHPQYQKNVTTIFGDAGAGYMHPFTLFGWDMNARADLRYRYDVQQPPHPDEQDPAPEHAYDDVIFNLGLQIPLSQAEEVVEAAPAPVAVVPAAYSDADNDGVIDERDQCPDTPAGTLVNNVGCPPETPAPAAAPEPAPYVPTLATAKAGDTIVLRGVNFDTGRDTLTANAKTLLDEVASQLNQRPELRIEIGGHTDSRGTETNNQNLSDRRATSVMAYLAEKGVDTGRLTAVGYGEGQPMDSNETNEGRERNRRVELKVLE